MNFKQALTAYIQIIVIFMGFKSGFIPTTRRNFKSVDAYEQKIKKDSLDIGNYHHPRILWFNGI